MSDSQRLRPLSETSVGDLLTKFVSLLEAEVLPEIQRRVEAHESVVRNLIQAHGIELPEEREDG